MKEELNNIVTKIFLDELESNRNELLEVCCPKQHLKLMMNPEALKDGYEPKSPVIDLSAKYIDKRYRKCLKQRDSLFTCLEAIISIKK